MNKLHSQIGTSGPQNLGAHRWKAALVTGLLALSPAIPVQLQAGLVSHLTFDNDSDPGHDSSVNNNHAGVNAAPGFSAAGISSGAADLTANNSYFNFPGELNAVEDTLEGAFTYSIWINTTQTFPSEGSATYEGASIIYADEDSAPNMSVTDLSGRNELVLGGNLIDSRYFSGLLDDFQAYNRPLTADEVLLLFDNPGATVPDLPPVAESFVITDINVAENGYVSLSWPAPAPDGVIDPLVISDEVERSGTLLPTSWSDITGSGAITIVAGVASFTDTDPPAGGKAFYRIAC